MVLVQRILGQGVSCSGSFNGGDLLYLQRHEIQHLDWVECDKTTEDKII